MSQSTEDVVVEVKWVTPRACRPSGPARAALLRVLFGDRPEGAIADREGDDDA